MFGVFVEFCVKEGFDVKKGDLIVVFSVMKMEMVIFVFYSGKIVSF